MEEKSGQHERQLRKRNQQWAIPPRHRNSVFVLFVEQVIGMISAENAMVDQRVPLERIAKPPHRLVHEIAMEEPFKKRSENSAG